MELQNQTSQPENNKNTENLRKNIRKNIFKQGSIAFGSLLLIVVLIFAMSAAWYTNVAKTSSLTFQTQSWGFDADNIKVAEDTVKITPGSSGIIPLQIDNSDSEDSLKITATVSKISMDSELQKRFYFYADTSKTYTFGKKTEATEANTDTEEADEYETETVSRVYLGASELDSYTYTILPGQKLILSDTYFSDVPLKWEWVYDLEGYYFRGSVDAQADNQVIVAEYLRPIEYDYDKAVYDKETGELVSIGEQTRAEFLEEFSRADGYQGAILEDSEDYHSVEITVTSDDEKSVRIYYPVEVDEDGYGVWAYLYTLEEIEDGIEYDTTLAKKEIQLNADLILTAQTVSTNAVEVSTKDDFLSALADEKSDYIKLGTDIALEDALVLEDGSEKLLNLNEYTLTLNGSVSVSKGSELTVLNGDIYTQEDGSSSEGTTSTAAFRAAGGKISLSSVRVNGFDTAVYIADQTVDEEDETLDSIVQITGCTFNTKQTAVFIQGNGSLSSTTTKVVIQDSKIHSDYIGISGQGTSRTGDERWGTELVVKDSTIDGKYAGIYQPQQQSTALLSGSTITGNTGLVVKGGSVTVQDCIVEGTGDVSVEAAGVSGGGFKDTGDGIYVEASYGWSATVMVKGDSKITSTPAYAVELFGVEGKGPGKVIIYGGTLTGKWDDTTNWNEIGIFEDKTISDNEET